MRRFLFALSLFAALLMAGCTPRGEKKAKYVFFFIGDGMGFGHVSLAEAYLSQEKGEKGQDPLTFTGFPVLGMATTYSASNPITCSSAAGTALATGSKTNNRMLGMDKDSLRLTSIAYKIHEAGYKVGVTSSVQVNHATPAAFYAHNVKRNNYYEIGKELPLTGFEFFGGGGLLHPEGKEKDLPSLYLDIEAAGYTVVRGAEAFRNAEKRDRMFLTQAENCDETLPFAYLRKESDLSLAQVIEAAISVLDNDKGFFLMAEGGLIDYAAHSNNTLGTIKETLDFDQAIEVAYQFYLQHPDETLIVVTADHETGGVTLGSKKGYIFDLTIFDEVKANTTDEDTYTEGSEDYKALSEEAHIGWTTTGHTGGAVPVWAVGAGSSLFAGRQDNTDIPRKICQAMGVPFETPAQ